MALATGLHPRQTSAMPLEDVGQPTDGQGDQLDGHGARRLCGVLVGAQLPLRGLSRRRAGPRRGACRAGGEPARRAALPEPALTACRPASRRWHRCRAVLALLARLDILQVEPAPTRPRPGAADDSAKDHQRRRADQVILRVNVERICR